MRFVNQNLCRRCTRRMQEIANIEPIGSTPGLVAFLCVECGSTDSILVYPVNRGREDQCSTQNTVEGRTMLKSDACTYSLDRGTQFKNSF